MQTVTIRHKGREQTVPFDGWQQRLDDMMRDLGGPWDAATSSVTVNVETPAAEPVKPVSEFGATVHDADAATRIGGYHDAIRESIPDFDGRKSQLYDTGTRMAAVGYDTQRKRAVEHNDLRGLPEAAGAIRDVIAAEKRREVSMLAGDVPGLLNVNGAVTLDGMDIGAHALRGLVARLGSPMARYVFGLRERIASEDATDAERAADKDALRDVIERECKRFPTTPLVWRVRDGLGDVFACVSPDYVVADAPTILDDVVRAFGLDAKGTWSYDPDTTGWEIRASVWTPTPTDEQAVGEPFRAWSSAWSRDNGGGAFNTGGGFDLLACLNAMIYSATAQSSRRAHRGGILRDIRRTVQAGTAAIRPLLDAWARARVAVVDLPDLVPIETAVPGFYRNMLTARRGELVGVLPGRSETHVTGLAMAYASERRDRSNITRADLANGWTRYVQTQPLDVRRDAEAAIGQWTVRAERVAYAAA